MNHGEKRSSRGVISRRKRQAIAGHCRRRCSVAPMQSMSLETALLVKTKKRLGTVTLQPQNHHAKKQQKHSHTSSSRSGSLHLRMTIITVERGGQHHLIIRNTSTTCLHLQKTRCRITGPTATPYTTTTTILARPPVLRWIEKAALLDI